MKFGLFTFVTDYSISAVDLGRAAEDLGFESLWLPEHTHIPTSRQSPWPGGAELPREYSHALDPFIALGAVAAATTHLRIGTGVCLVVERDPITLAKEVATLDHLSNGRFLFGIGAGWNKEEMRHHGTDPATRFSLLRERTLAMKEIWTRDEAEYHHDLVNFDPIWSWPKPIQKPHPPIYIGGNGPRTLQRVVDYGDAWMPIAGRAGQKVEDRFDELQQLAAEAGRGPIPISLFSVPPDPKEIERYATLGVERCIFWLPAAARDEIMPRVRQCAEAARSFR